MPIERGPRDHSLDPTGQPPKEAPAPTPAAVVVVDPQDLDGWLGRVYGARHGLAQADSVSRFSQALQGDSDLQQSAAARLAELEALDAACSGNIARRCILSKAHLDALRLILRK